MTGHGGKGGDMARRKKKTLSEVWTFIRDDFSTFLVLSLVKKIELYVIIVLAFSWLGKEVPDSLNYLIGTLAGIEFTALAGIKIAPKVKGKKKEQAASDVTVRQDDDESGE